jgi:hypothetical protein
MKDSPFEYHRQIGWGDMFPKPKPRNDAPSAEDLARLEDIEFPSDYRAPDFTITGPPRHEERRKETAPMAATPIPTVKEAEAHDQALRSDFATRCAELQRDLDAFKKKVQQRAEKRIELRPGIVQEAKDLKERGDAIASAFEKSPWPERTRTANWLHKALTAGRAWVFGPIEEAEKVWKRLAFDLQRQEQVKADTERRRIEDEQRRQQEEQRKKDVEALKSEGRPEEAASVEAAPLPPVLAPVPKETAKIPGVASISASAKLKSITDAAALAGWLAKNPTLLLHLFDVKDGAWKKMLTDHLDKKTGAMSIEIPGIEWELVGTVRGKSNADV